MTPALSDVERRLLERWRDSSYNKPRLTAVEIRARFGLRGIRELLVHFEYPVTAIAGANGSGKTTLLACCACAYHNDGPFVPTGCTAGAPYYTYGQFFQISTAEQKQRDIVVAYAHAGEGLPGVHEAIKKNKWTRYENRPQRCVQFSGLSRALPAFERVVYRSHFGGAKTLSGSKFAPDETNAINRILDSRYREVWLAKSTRYSLNVAFGEGFAVTGFNLGAGEDSTFQLCHLAQRLPNGALFLIEEIEASLHPRAQTRLVKQLLDLSWERHLQIIFTTHSRTVLDAVPPPGRLFLRRSGPVVNVMPGISPDYAFTMMASTPVCELAVYVEDAVAKGLVLESLDAATRRRVRIVPVGSWVSVVGQLVAHVRNPALGKCLAVLDGERKPSEVEDQLRRQLGSKPADSILKSVMANVLFLPGGIPPESWLSRLFSENASFLEKLKDLCRLSDPEILDVQTVAQSCEPRSLLFEVSQHLGHDETTLLSLVAVAAVQSNGTSFDPIRKRIDEVLSAD